MEGLQGQIRASADSPQQRVLTSGFIGPDTILKLTIRRRDHRNPPERQPLRAPYFRHPQASLFSPAAATRA